MYRAKVGDVFSIPIGKKEFLSGRVLLDVETQCVAPGRLSADSPLVFFSGAMLVEVHGSPVPKPAVADERVLIPSIFVVASALTSGRWRVVGHRPIDPMFVDFPPALTLVGPEPHLAWGELQLPISLSVGELETLDISPTLEMSRVDQIALFALGREEDIDRKRVRNLDILRLDHSDVRFHPRREELFKLAGLPPQPTYYDEALKRGFDLRRFYDADPRVPFHVCPYCWARRTPEDICWACGEDTSRDAVIETTQQELDTMERKTCPSCKTSIPEDAIICATCRTKQPDE
jgi:hypothetical protein